MRTKEDYINFLAEVRKVSGVDSFVPDETGLVSVKVDDAYIVNLQFVEATGKIICFIEVTELPTDTGCEVYRDLLAGGLFGKETAGGFFTLEPETNTVIYNYFFELEMVEKDVEDFIATLEKILQLCDLWTERIKEKMGSGEAGSKETAPQYRVFV